MSNFSRVYDHSTKGLLKGFRMPSLGWSDGNSYLPVDFILLSASEPKKRLHDADKTLDRRGCAYRRRQEAVLKATAHLAAIIGRAREAGIEAAHRVMDSWFTMPATVAKLSGLINVIGMLKHSPKIHYRFQEMNMDLAAIHRKIRK